MATVDVTGGVGGLTHPSAHAKVYQAGFVAVKVNFAKAAAKKGSALAAGDEIRVIEVPANTVVKMATAQVKTAVGAGTTALTLDVDLEVDGTDTALITGYNAKTATVGIATAEAPADVAATTKAGYIKVTLGTLTGDAPAGEVIVGVEFIDVSDRAQNAGLATRT